MKHLEEYRDPELVKHYLTKIHQEVTRPWNIMEICGGQTHSLVKNGIIALLPKEITLVHGPGCPVCVTPLNMIDKAVHLAMNEDIILCSYGDMLRVPGSKKSLLTARAEGADVRMMYSPLNAVELAKKHPEKEFVFFAVGFETTAPANALSVIQAAQMGLKNYSILTSHVLVPPAMEAILSDEDNLIQGFLAAGHVCTIMGIHEYQPIVEKYKVPIVVTGFEPVDLLQGIYMTLVQLEHGEYTLENQYSRVVEAKGNVAAQETIYKVFEVTDRGWRGIGNIPMSGYEVKSDWEEFDARKRYQIEVEEVTENPACIAGMILRGKRKPHDCSAFGNECTPDNPLGAPMVSSEGACAAYFHYANEPLTHE